MSPRRVDEEIRETELGLGLQEEVGVATLPEERRVVERAPVREPATPLEWVRDNLFSSAFNTVLTVMSAAFAVFVVYQTLKFVFVSGDWEVFRANARVYMVGRFPFDELWRVWTIVYLLALLGGMSKGISPARARWTAARVAVAVALGAFALLVTAYVNDSSTVWLLLGVAVALIAVGFAIGRVAGRRLYRSLFVAWLLAFPAVIVILRLFDGVPPRLWGGFLLNVIVAVVAIGLSFPVGLLLALGRRSSLPAIRMFSVGFIELIRGVPLYTLLIFGVFLLPLLLPPGLNVPLIIQVMVMFTIFSSAYVAEIVRGGLQGVPHGQYEAARALALPTWRMMAFVVLPQALRSTIPAMISHFISLFKDTSLLATVGLLELLRQARRASAGLGFAGDSQEALLPAALLFFVVAFSMSRWSQRLERRLGVGER